MHIWVKQAIHWLSIVESSHTSNGMGQYGIEINRTRVTNSEQGGSTELHTNRQ